MVQHAQMTRRGFIGKVAAGTLATVGTMEARGALPLALAQEPEPTAFDSENISETIDTDIVILGSGASGLACAVQAADLGLSTLVLEKAGFIGGNSNGTEGVFAIGTRFQQEKGIELTPRDIITQEMPAGQYRPDGAMWLKFIKSSLDNFTWCEDHGVIFTGLLVNEVYGSTGHTFDTNGSVGYVAPMRAAAEAAGVEFRLNTPGVKLIHEGGIVKGVYALDEEGGTIQVNAKATILATGGIGTNAQLLKGQGWTDDQLAHMISVSVPFVEGDGYLMAMEVGAKDFLSNASLQVFNGIEAVGSDTTVPLDSPLNSALGIAANPLCVWVNQDGVRNKDESMCFTYNMAATGTALMCNKASYAFFDEKMLMGCVANEEDEVALEEAISGRHDDSMFKADTVEELAEHFGLDPAVLKATIDEYNGYCEMGEDPDFGKPAQYLQPFVTPPYYLAKLVPMFVAVDGGITTNIKSEAVDSELDPIPGLYAVGLDGAMLWRNVYTQNISGTMMGNNIHSGRTAAKSAKEYIDSMR